MALSDIIDRITSDTDRKISSIREETDDTIDTIISECEEECDQILKEAREEGEKRAVEFRKRMKIEVNLETRKELLRGRKQLIDQVFEEAKKRLYADEERYRRFLEERVFMTAEQGNEKVIFSGDDYERFKEEGLQKIIGTVNDRLYNDDRKGDLVLTNERGDFHGGFMLKKGRSRTIMTMDAVFTGLKDSFETDVASILSGNGNT